MTLVNCSPPGFSNSSKSMDFSRQEYWIWLNLSNPGIKSRSPALQVDSLLSDPPEKPSLLVAYTKWSLKFSEPMHCSLIFLIVIHISLLLFSTESLHSLIVHAFRKYHFHLQTTSERILEKKFREDNFGMFILRNILKKS